MSQSRYFLAVVLAIAHPFVALAEDSRCEFNDQQKRLGLGGKQVIGDPEADEYFNYESRVEALGEVNRFLYCVKNGSKYQVLTIDWSKDSDHPYFRASVAPQKARTVYSDEVDAGFEHAPRKLKFGDREIEPHTVITPTDAAGYKNTTLHSGGTFDIPASAEVARAVNEGAYKNYSPDDFVTVGLSFASTKSGPAEASIVENTVSFYFVDDVDRGLKAFAAWPKYLITPTPDFIQFQAWDEKFLAPETWLDNKPYAFQTFRFNTRARQKKAVLQVSDGKEVLLAMPVSYFAP